MAKIINLLRGSANIVTRLVPSSEKTVIPEISDTRWVERQEVVQTFFTLFSTDTQTLKEISPKPGDHAASECVLPVYLHFAQCFYVHVHSEPCSWSNENLKIQHC